MSRSVLSCRVVPPGPAVASNWCIDLVEAHPDLFCPPQGVPAAAEGLPDCDRGWAFIIDTACMRIRSALAKDGRPLRITRVREKAGTLRIDWTGRLSARTEERVGDIIDLAEACSACTCELCGARGRLFRNGRILMTRCESHSSGVAAGDGAGIESMVVLHRISEGRQTIESLRYDRRTDSFVSIDPALFGLRGDPK